MAFEQVVIEQGKPGVTPAEALEQQLPFEGLLRAVGWAKPHQQPLPAKCARIWRISFSGQHLLVLQHLERILCRSWGMRFS